MLRALIKAMRPRQWSKNIFVLAAVVFDRQLPNPMDVLVEGQLWQVEPLLRSLAAFALFCLISSSVYLINDIKDIESDRKHPTKRLRPIASGKLPISVAWIAAAALIAFTLPVSYLLSENFAAVILVYLIVNLAYSNWLKHVPLVDVLVLATGFVLRVAAGVLVLESVERFSPWLYVAMTMLALYMGFGKRRSELALMAEEGGSSRKVLDGYTLPLLDQLILVVSSTTIITYSLYTFSAPNVPQNHTMMLTIPFVLYAIFRYLYLIQVKQAGGAPEELLLSDRPLQIAVSLWALSILLIFYIF